MRRRRTAQGRGRSLRQWRARARHALERARVDAQRVDARRGRARHVDERVEVGVREEAGQLVEDALAAAQAGQPVVDQRDAHALGGTPRRCPGRRGPRRGAGDRQADPGQARGEVLRNAKARAESSKRAVKADRGGADQTHGLRGRRGATADDRRRHLLPGRARPPRALRERDDRGGLRRGPGALGEIVVAHRDRLEAVLGEILTPAMPRMRARLHRRSRARLQHVLVHSTSRSSSGRMRGRGAGPH
jgi:hypothetical protein